MFRSIRAKLTLGYTAILSVTLILFGIVAYVSTSTSLTENLDLSLRNEVRWLRQIIEPRAKKIRPKPRRRTPPPPAPTKQELASRNKKKAPIERKSIDEWSKEDSIAADQIWNQIYQHTFQNPKKVLIQINDRNNDLLYKSASLGDDSLAYDDVPYNRINLATVAGPKDQQIRLAATENEFVKIYVAYPVAELTEALQSLFSIFLFLVPIAVVVSIAGGWFLAKKSLQPVDEITRTARDITAQNLDREIPERDVNDEIGRLASTFNEMIRRLKQSFDQVKQFTVDASHELRTPLTIMRGEVELAMRSKKSSDEYRRILASNLDEILRLQSIIDNLLILSKSDLGQASLAFERLDLEGIFRELYEDAELLALPKRINVRLGRNDHVMVRGDKLRLRQLLLNLIDNALKYTPESGTVTLALEAVDGSARISVMDTGIGIPKEDREKIFDRFYRVDKARSRELGGSGLGLAISKWIVDSHGGTITVESIVNSGSTFTVTIPSLNDEGTPS